MTPGTPAPGQEAEAARHAGRDVESLDYEAHESMALRVLERIADEIADRFSVTRLAIVHRTRGGAARRRQRSPCWQSRPIATRHSLAARYAIDETKARAPIWKAERFADGHVWVGHAARSGPGEEPIVRVYLSVDMEGIGGISHPDPTDPKDVRYPTSVALMIGETNAAIEGALDAGATDVLVNDSHWNMYNLLPAELHPAARVLQGQKAWSMVAGAQPGPDGEPSFDVALFVGYHARAGHPTGTIAHTYSGAPVETRLDGRPTGEYGINALALGAWGIPVGLVCGDDALAARGRGLAAVGRAGRRQDGGLDHERDQRPPDGRLRAGPRRRAPGRRTRRDRRHGPRRRPAAVDVSGRLSSSRSSTPEARSPTMPRSSPGRSGVGDRGVRIVSDDPVLAYRGLPRRRPLGRSHRMTSTDGPFGPLDRAASSGPRRSPARGAPAPGPRRPSARSGPCSGCSGSAGWTARVGRLPAPPSTAG